MSHDHHDNHDNHEHHPNPHIDQTPFTDRDFETIDLIPPRKVLPGKLGFLLNNSFRNQLIKYPIEQICKLIINL